MTSNLTQLKAEVENELITNILPFWMNVMPDASALKEAIKLFELIEKHSFDPVNNGYFEAFTCEWGEISDMRLSEKDANEKKT